jgi:hypothetical protein
VDEFLIRDGPLSNYRVLVWVDGNVTERFAIEKVIDWVKSGGVLLVPDLGDVETVEGDKRLWRTLVPENLSGAVPLGVYTLGKGAVIRMLAKPNDYPAIIDAVVRVAYYLSEYGSRFRNAPLIDDADDGIVATLLPDRILYFNGTDKEIIKHIRLRPEDWVSRSKKPKKLEFDLAIGPHSIEAVMLE